MSATEDGPANHFEESAAGPKDGTVCSVWPHEWNGRWMGQEAKKGLVSVIVPTYNRVDLLAECLESVREQRYRPVEVLVVDDGSTDGTQELLRDEDRKARAEDGFQLRWWRQENRGAPAARNVALDQSRGAYVQFLDSDDLLARGKVEEQVEAMSSGTWDMTWSDSRTFRKTPEEAQIAWTRSTWSNPLSGFVRSHCLPWDYQAPLYSRDLCRTLGPWNERLICWQDWEYNIRALCLDPHIRYVPGTHSLVREHQGKRITDLSTGKASAKGRWLALESARNVLEATDHMCRRYEAEFCKHYVDVARRAGVEGRDSLSGRALKRARKRARGTVGRVEVAVFEVLWKHMGLGPASYCLGVVQDEQHEPIRTIKKIVRKAGG